MLNCVSPIAYLSLYHVRCSKIWAVQPMGWVGLCSISKFWAASSGAWRICLLTITTWWGAEMVRHSYLFWFSASIALLHPCFVWFWSLSFPCYCCCCCCCCCRCCRCFRCLYSNLFLHFCYCLFPFHFHFPFSSLSRSHPRPLSRSRSWSPSRLRYHDIVTFSLDTDSSSPLLTSRAVNNCNSRSFCRRAERICPLSPRIHIPVVWVEELKGTASMTKLANVYWPE